MTNLNFNDLEIALIALGQLLQDGNLDYQIVAFHTKLEAVVNELSR